MSRHGKPGNRALAFAVIAPGAALPLPPSRAASPSALPPSARGHVTLLDFWATTCGPCRPALTRLQSLHVRCPRLAVLGIAMDEADTQAEVKPLLREQGVTYPVRIASAANLRLAQALGVQTYPALYLLDARGKVVWSHSGPLDEGAAQALTRQVARLLTIQGHGSRRQHVRWDGGNGEVNCRRCGSHT